MTHRALLLFRFRHFAARWLSFVLLAAAGLNAFAQDTDPPGRVAYLNFRQGALSVSPSGDNSWYEPEANRPLTQGDRLWTDRNGRAELYVGDVAVRMDEQTQLEISELDDQTLRLTLQQGRVQMRLRGDSGGDQERVELGTGNLAVVMRAPGDYRVQADPQADTTQVMVAQGSASVYGDGGQSHEIGSRQQAVYTGRDLSAGGAPQALPEVFEHWVAERNRLEDQSQSARYISREIPGYMQLDQHGQWQNDPTYGAVWYPDNVASDWSPYSDGYWAVVAPWGYTWIDRAPWGFAPMHYGRWTRVGSRWCWVPGQRHVRPVYAPALVAFVGGVGGNFVVRGGHPAVGWFPLAPGDRWRPPYRTSERYVDRANRMVMGVRPAPAYANRELPHAVTAVPLDRFGHGGPIGRRDFVRPPAPAVAAAQPTQRPPMPWPAAGVSGRGTPDAGRAEYFGRRSQAAPPPVAAITPPQQPDRFQRDRDDRRPGRDDAWRQQQQQQQRQVEQQQQAGREQRLQQEQQKRQLDQQRQMQQIQQQEGQRREQQAQQEQARQQREAVQQQQQVRQQQLEQQHRQEQRQQQMDLQRQQDQQQRAAQAQQAQRQAQQQAEQREQQLQQQQQMQMRQQQIQQQQRQQQMDQQRQQEQQQRTQQMQQQQAAQRAQQEQAQMQMQRQQQEQQQRMQQMQQQQAAQRAQQEQAQRQMQHQMEQQRQMQQMQQQQQQQQQQQRQAEQMARQQEMQQRAQQQAQQQAQQAQQRQQQGGNRGRDQDDDRRRP